MFPVILALAGRDGWLSGMLAIPGGLMIVICLWQLGRTFPGKTLVELCTLITGDWLGRIIGLLYIWYFLFIAALTLRALMDFMVTVFMPETPMPIIGILFILLCAYVVKTGIEVLARTSQLFAFIAIVSGAFLFAALLPEKDYELLLPILGNGLGPVLAGAIPILAVWSEIVVFTMLQGQIREQTPVLRVKLLAILLTWPSFVSILAASVAVFGLPVAVNLSYPCLSLLQMISVGEFLERIEAYGILIWVVGSFFKISIFYYAASLGIAQWLNLRNYQPLVLPLGAILVCLSVLLFQSFPEYNEFMKKTYSLYSLTMGFVLPLILLLVSFVFRKKKC